MNKPTDRNLWRCFFVLFCASLVACQSVFGSYQAGDSSAGIGGNAGAGGIATAGKTSKAGNSSVGGGGNGGATSPNACDSDGIYRCTDTAVEVCTNHQWKALLPCSRDLCDADRGRCMACAPGSNRCSAFNLQTCTSTGDSWNTTHRCDTAEYCDSVSNNCFACLSGEAFCSGASLYRCNATKNGWNVEDCGSSDLCDSSAQTCGERCPNKDWVSCNGATLIGCDGNGHHTELDTCGSSQLCQQTLEERANDPASWSGKCSVGCTPNTYQCNPDNLAELRGCPPSGLSWEHIEDCLTPELCDAANKQCDQGCGVPPGTYRCNGARLEKCRADGTDFEVIQVCDLENRCNAQKHTCVTCAPGDFQCTSATLQQCGQDSTWTTLQTCPSVALCDATHGQCLSSSCSKPGAYQCKGATLQQCSLDLTTWNDKQTCATAALCDFANGRCITPECDYPNSYRCQGNTRQICDDATRKWTDVNYCGSDQVCDLSGCSNSCPALPWRCNTVGTLTVTQSCSMVNGVPKWTTVDTCATAALCNVGDAGATCSAPICKAGEYKCDGSVLKLCNAGRTGFDTVKTCASGQICDATGGQCDVCVANTYACYQVNSNPARQLLKCDATGQSNFVVDNCDSAARCYTSSNGLDGYCYRCDAGNTQCVGSTQIESCASDRRGWNTPTSCPSGCVDSGDSDYCATCAANEVECVQFEQPGSTHTCTPDRRAWGSTTTCAQRLGCVDSGTADYCASTCTPNAWECINSTNSKHQCNSDGKGWGSNISECADDKNQKACSGGQLSGSTPCPTATPYCLATTGQCVECVGTATECTASNQLRTCSNNKWVYTTCSGSTSICSASANKCVACTSSSSPTCTNSTTSQYCTSSNTWATTPCSGTTPVCNSATGTCAECDPSTYTPICVDSNTQVQSCQDGKLVKTSCSANGQVCYAASGASAVCADCNADTTPVCLTDGITLRSCSKGTFADAKCSSGYCLNNKCTGCNGSSLAKCSKDDTISTCDNGSWGEHKCPTDTPVCDDQSQSSSGAKCVACHNSTGWQCNGTNTRHSCVNNQNVDETCPSGEVCDPTDATCKASVCTPNALSCADNTVVQCNAYGTAAVPMQTCAAVCWSGACVTCKPGTSTCDGATGVHTCNEDGKGWGATTSKCATDSSLMTCSGGSLSSTTPQACPSTKPACSDGACSGCSSNADCSGTPSTPVCSNYRCVVCAQGQRECLNGIPQLCSGNTWSPQTSCGGTKPVCQTSTGECGCSKSDDCAGMTTTPVCMTATGTCGCSENSDCSKVSAQARLCNQSSHICVACIFPSDCSGTRPVCDDGSCVACSPSTPCAAGTCQADGSCLVSDGG